MRDCVTMRTDVYEALRAINVPEGEARRVAESVTGVESSLQAVERDLTVLKWMVGTNIVLTLAMLAGIGTLYAKIVDLAFQVGTLAGRLH